MNGRKTATMTASTTILATLDLLPIAVAGAVARRLPHIHQTRVTAHPLPTAARALPCPHLREATEAHHQVRAAEETPVDLTANSAIVHAHTRVRGLVRAHRVAVAATRRVRLRVRHLHLPEGVAVVVVQEASGVVLGLAIRRLPEAVEVEEVPGGAVARATAATAAIAGAGAGAREEEEGGKMGK